MAKKKTTKPKVSSSTAKKLSGILKSVGVNVSASKIQSIVAKSGGSSSNKNVASTPATKPFNIMDYVTPGKEAEAQAIINKGSGGGSTTAPGAGMSQSQFVDYLVSQGIVTDKAGAYKTLGLTPEAPLPEEVPQIEIDPNNPFMKNLPANWDTYSPLQKSMYLAEAVQMNDALMAGKELNPNVELSPEVLKKFITDATAQLDPYYQEKFGLEKNKFETSISQMMSDYNKNLGRLDTTFKQTLGTQAEGEANLGTAFSSGRKQRQERTIDLQNQDIEDYTTGIQRTGQELATEYEKQFGSSGLRTLNIPGLTAYKASTAGVSPQTSTRSLYTPLGTVALGEQNRARELAIKQEADALEQSYRGNRSLTGQY